ncbi:phosphatidylserine decarboxylase [bacterium]|nr:MAG: phosphatidylserine decarboxylase [bacterium]
MICAETLAGDRLLRTIYSEVRERSPWVYRMATGPVATRTLGAIMYGGLPCVAVRNPVARMKALGMEPGECLNDPKKFRTAREIFERKIRYWEYRSLCRGTREVASPSDSRVLVGSLSEQKQFFLKEKFFRLEELLGEDRTGLTERFEGGDFAIFRLTPEKYHYNHVPVSGVVREIYELGGRFHSCNPGAVLSEVTPYGKNKRVVTLIDTDVPGGTEVGLVAMVEVVAMMIGKIVQCYSEYAYDNPRRIEPEMFLRKGQPKSLFMPGSSTNVLIFEKGRVKFAPDLVRNQRRSDVHSRFTLGFEVPLAETDIKVRSLLAVANESFEGAKT